MNYIKFIIHLIKSWAVFENMLSSNIGLFAKINSLKESNSLFSYLKGGSPDNNSYVSIPIDHISIDSVWPLPRIVSGAKYSGVPDKIKIVSKNKWKMGFI